MVVLVLVCFSCGWHWSTPAGLRPGAVLGLEVVKVGK